MFGSTNGATPGRGAANRPTAVSVARIDGHLTHVLVGDEGEPDGISVFVDARAVPIGEVESLSVDIVAPTDREPSGTLTAILSRYSGGGTAEAGAPRPQSTVALFPGTVEIIAHGRRITVTCQTPGSFDGLWLGLGLRSDGTSTELTGVQSLNVLVSPESRLVDAKLTWSDTGATEDLLG
jgi:hypothetical protein